MILCKLLSCEHIFFDHILYCFLSYKSCAFSLKLWGKSPSPPRSIMANMLDCDIIVNGREDPQGLVPNMQDCDFVVSEFELQSCYYVLFQSNTTGKSMNSLFTPESP